MREVARGARRLTCPVPPELSRHGVARDGDVTRHPAGADTMIIPSVPSGVPGPGRLWRAMAPPTSPCSEAIVRARRG
jgi:hypothetical protein